MKFDIMRCGIDFCGCAIDCIRRNIWILVSYVAVYFLGIVMGVILSNSANVLLFFESSTIWFTNIVICGNFFLQLWRFLIFNLLLVAIFFCCCFWVYAFPISYFVLLIRGFVFAISLLILFQTFSFVTIIFFLFVFLFQQVAMLYQLCAVSCTCICKRPMCKDELVREATMFAIQCLVFALVQTLLIFVIVKPLLSFA